MDATPLRHVIAIALVIALLALLISCAEETNPDPLLPPEQTVDVLVSTTGWFPTIVPDSTVYAVARFDSAHAEAGLMCGDFVGTQLREVDVLTALVADTAIHYPGAVLQYAHLDQLAPTMVLGDRAAGELVLTGADGDALTGQVAALGGAAVENWRLATLPSLPVAAGTWRFSLHELRDPEQVALGAGVHPDALPAAVADALQPRDLDHARVLIRLQRTHHTVACTYPGSAGGAFADHVVGADLADQMAEGNPPVWVDRVHHGQLLLIAVQAAAGFDELVEAARNSVAAAVAGSDPEPGLLSLDDLEILDVAAHGIAADAPAAIAALQDGTAALASLLAAPADDPADLPAVTAELKALRNGGRITLSIEDGFEFTSCVLYEPVFDEVIWGLDPADARVQRSGSDLRSDRQGEFLYRGAVLDNYYDHVVTVPDLKGQGQPSVPNQFGRRPVLWQDMANGHPVIELFELGLPDGNLFAEMLFDGQPFVTTYYTLFLVFGTPDRVRLTVITDGDDVQISRLNMLNLIIDGVDGGTFRDNLTIGWDDGVLRYAHDPYEVAVPRALPVGWHVFAFRCGDAGMTIFEDGVELEHIDWDFTLLEFAGATLCARRQGFDAPAHAVLWLAEAVAYRGAGDNETVQLETQRLREKYGF